MNHLPEICIWWQSVTKFAIALAVAALGCLCPTPTRCALFASAVRLFAVLTRSFFSCDFFCSFLCRPSWGARSRLSVAKEWSFLWLVRSFAVSFLVACPPRWLCVWRLSNSSPCFCPHFFLLLPAHFCALLIHFLSFLALDQARLSLSDGLARCSRGPCFRFSPSPGRTLDFFLKSRAASAAQVCLGMIRYASLFPVRANPFLVSFNTRNIWIRLCPFNLIFNKRMRVKGESTLTC